jgi:hypothetical protein
VYLDLVDGRRNPGLGDDAVQVGALEVRDSGGAQPPSSNQPVHGSPGRDVVTAVQGGERPVDQEQIELFKAKVL